jgi:PAS domain S-box-containing protein
MNTANFQLLGLEDSRLAPHAASALPAWLWSLDGARILWGNPVGAKVFGASNGAALCERAFGPADAHRRQIAQLARRLPATGELRLERLRGFGAPLSALVTCGCARLEFADAGSGILIAVAEAVGRTLAPVERLQSLVAGVDRPAVSFTRDGMLAGANAAARSLFEFANLADAGLADAAKDALMRGRAEITNDIGHLVLHRVGVGGDAGLVALITPRESAAQSAPSAPVSAQAFVSHAAPEAPDEQAAMAEHEQRPDSGGAQPEFELVDEFAESAPPPPLLEEPSASPRRHPLRFMWQMDAETRFSIGSEEFTRLIGMRTAAGFGRLWSEIAEEFGLDPNGDVLGAVASHRTWSGITLNWPVDGGGRLPVELAGLPVFDSTRNFAGYRGFGVCRDVDGLNRLTALRRLEFVSGEPPAQTLSADVNQADVADEPASALSELPASTFAGTAASIKTFASDNSSSNDLETSVETPPVEIPKNVVPFRPPGEAKSPVLTAVENNAFDELARQLSARLQSEGTLSSAAASSHPLEIAAAHPALSQTRAATEQPGWLVQPEPPPRGQAQRDRTLLDLLPVGVLIYRLDRLVYANAAFLKRMGFADLHALEEAGGLDALYVEAGVSSSSSTSDTGTPVTISGPQAGSASPCAIDARLYTIAWDDESALALIFSGSASEAVTIPTTAVPVGVAAPPGAEPALLPVATDSLAPSPVGHADAEELGAILDTTTDGILMFDAQGNLNSCNRSAEALFGYEGDELTRRNLTDLFAPESQRLVSDYLESVKSAGLASLLDHGRDVLGRVNGGGIVPLSMTMGRTRHDGPNFFAVFRDLSQTRKTESELQQARRLADRAAAAQADLLARISHEVRAPLNAIVGFAEVMIGERFGALGTPRYVEYMKDIRASGQRVVAIINDLLDLSRIETGKLDLTFANQNLNDLVEQCVAAMQPQANRERIIIRTSLGQGLPPVIADAGALRQIALNLIGNSIHLANPGGQVIVSTALSDFGEVVLRVRDTGNGLSEHEVAAAMEPFRTRAPSDQASDSSPVNLSLTKALVEANRAQFQIRTGGHSGTLIEVVFPQQMARA